MPPKTFQKTCFQKPNSRPPKHDTPNAPILPYTRVPFNPRPKPEAERPTRGRYRAAQIRRPKSCAFRAPLFHSRPFRRMIVNGTIEEGARIAQVLGASRWPGRHRRWSGLTPPTVAWQSLTPSAVTGRALRPRPKRCTHSPLVARLPQLARRPAYGRFKKQSFYVASHLDLFSHVASHLDLFSHVASYWFYFRMLPHIKFIFACCRTLNLFSHVASRT